MEQLGLFNLGGGTIYDADEDIFIELNKGIHGGDIGGKFRNPIEKAIIENTELQTLYLE